MKRAVALLVVLVSGCETLDERSRAEREQSCMALARASRVCFACQFFRDYSGRPIDCEKEGKCYGHSERQYLWFEGRCEELLGDSMENSASK